MPTCELPCKSHKYVFIIKPFVCFITYFLSFLFASIMCVIGTHKCGPLCCSKQRNFVSYDLVVFQSLKMLTHCEKVVSEQCTSHISIYLSIYIFFWEDQHGMVFLLAIVSRIWEKKVWVFFLANVIFTSCILFSRLLLVWISFSFFFFLFLKENRP